MKQMEIERKFLVLDLSFLNGVEGDVYKQGYLSSEENSVVRIRVTNKSAFITIKSKVQGISRDEFEYEIPRIDGEGLLQLCQKPIIEKMRYKIPKRDFVWEVDVFDGENKGMVVAEIELQNEDDLFEKPEWLGEEVTGDIRYYNSQLINNPYSKWKNLK